MKKRIMFTTAIALVCVMVFGSISVFAQGQGLGDLEREMRERDALLAQCPEHNALVAQREAEFQEFLRQDAMNRRNRSFIFNTLNIPVFQQEHGNWCGPATARQVIHFRNGHAPSQADLARLIRTHDRGSDVHYVGLAVNAHTGMGYVGRHMSHNRNGWVDQIRFSIDARRPALITIDTTRVAAFPYNSPGHIVNVSGYDLYFSQWDFNWTGAIRITDPFGPGLGNRWYSINDLFNAHVTHRVYPFAGRASW